MINGPNGHASGNRIEEAIVHAANEIFERRAHITVLRDRLVMPTFDIDTVTDPVLQAQIEFVRSKGIEIVLKDLSFGGQLPCIGAYFFDPHIPEDYQFHHFFKVGASFNAEIALSRIFTEYTQGRRLDEFIEGQRAEDQKRILEHDFRALKCMDDDGDNYLSAFMFGFVPYKDAAFLREGDVIPFDPSRGYTDCLDDIERAKEICRALEKDLLVVDFTDPEIGFPVVAVVIPGYSDVLPYHPENSRVLYEKWTREEVLKAYDL
jgi:ribosomal protein S12 methylthiotransferase accessory factor